MTRYEKLHKLSNAIKEYRGKKNEATGKWIDQPKPSARKRVERWLAELGMNPASEIQRIDGFKTYAEFFTWIKSR